MKIFDKKKVDYVFGTVMRNYTKSKILKYKLDPQRIYYNFDFATAHSTGFFLKRDIYKKVGLYNLNFKCSSDYDLYFRVIKNDFIGTVTKKNDLIGNVARGGFSSKVSFLDHLIEETRIRIHNKQNFLIVIILFLNSLFKYVFKNFL